MFVGQESLQACKYVVRPSVCPLVDNGRRICIAKTAVDTRTQTTSPSQKHTDAQTHKQTQTPCHRLSHDLRFLSELCVWVCVCSKLTVVAAVLFCSSLASMESCSTQSDMKSVPHGESYIIPDGVHILPLGPRGAFGKAAPVLTSAPEL